MFRVTASAALPVLLTLLAGCAPPDPPTYPVEGTVKFEGKPLVGFLVEFSSVADDTKGLSAVGETDAQGKFTLKTTVNGKEKVGAVGGKHKAVVIVPPIGRGPAVVPPVALKYQDYNSSGLTVEVRPGEANRAELVVTR